MSHKKKLVGRMKVSRESRKVMRIGKCEEMFAISHWPMVYWIPVYHWLRVWRHTRTALSEQKTTVVGAGGRNQAGFGGLRGATRAPALHSRDVPGALARFDTLPHTDYYETFQFKCLLERDKGSGLIDRKEQQNSNCKHLNERARKCLCWAEACDNWHGYNE